MPGPLSGARFEHENTEEHAKCREKRACKGPGCRVKTGKTQRKRERGQ